MELRQLRYFVAVAEERHFGHAAQRLRIAAPSLSQQIQALERDLHVTLLARSPRSVVLTPAGEVLLEHAHVLLARAERARDEVRCADGRHRHLTLRVVPGVEHVLDGPLRHLSGRASQLEVTTATSTGSDAIRAVREEHVDAAIVWVRSTQDQDLTGTILRQVPVYLALPAGAPARRRGSSPDRRPRRRDDRDVPPATSSSASGTTSSATCSPPADLAPTRCSPNLINAPEAMLRSVAAGHGVAPVAPAMAEHVAVAGIVVRPLAPPLLAPLELVWREPAHPALQDVVALLAGTEV